MKLSPYLKMGLILAMLAVVLVACGSETAVPEASTVDISIETQVVPVEGGTFTHVSAPGLAVILENKDFPLINVHIPYAGDIEGTDANIPFDQIAQNLDQLPAENKPNGLQGHTAFYAHKLRRVLIR